MTPMKSLIPVSPSAKATKYRTGTHHHKSQWFRMFDEPAGDKQANGEQNGDDCEPISSRPPERKKEARSEDDTGNLGSHDVEPTENQQRADD